MQRSPRIGLNYVASVDTTALQNASILAPRAAESHHANARPELRSAFSYAPHFGLKDAASALPFPALLLSSTTAHRATRTQPTGPARAAHDVAIFPDTSQT